MDNDDQTPNTPPVTPEVEKTEPTEATPEETVEEAPKPEASDSTEEPTAEPVEVRVESTQVPVEPVETPAETPVEPAIESTPADSNMAAEMDKLLNDEVAAPAPAPEPQPVVSKGHNHIGIIIILSLLVLAAVGFAIFEYITANNATCDCPKCEAAKCDCDEKEEVSSEDYIYIGDFGIKVEKPDNWKSSIASYAFYNSSQAVESFEIRGISESEIQPNIMISPRTKACEKLSKSIDSENLDSEAEVNIGQTCIEIDDTYIDVFTNNGVSDELVKHFTDEENYSKI